MKNELEFWLFVISVIGCGLVFGYCIGFVAGRESMLKKIHGRRRSGVYKRAVRRLDKAVESARQPRDILNAEVIE